MTEWLARHRFGVTVTTLLLLPLLLMFLHGKRGGGSVLQSASTGLAGLVQEGIGSLVGAVAGVLGDYIFLVNVQEKNHELTEERERLLGEALLAKRLAVQNDQLRKLLGLKEARRDLTLAPASVIAREVTPFHRVGRLAVEVDTDEELAPDMAVITHQGLLGRVVRVSRRYADVMLLTDMRSRVACEVLGKGVLGMLQGSGSLDQYRARLQVSVTEEPLEKDAVIITSGYDRVFPRGIEVGYVTDPSSRRLVGQFVEYDVVLAANPALSDEAMVVIKGPSH